MVGSAIITKNYKEIMESIKIKLTDERFQVRYSTSSLSLSQDHIEKLKASLNQVDKLGL